MCDLLRVYTVSEVRIGVKAVVVCVCVCADHLMDCKSETYKTDQDACHTASQAISYTRRVEKYTALSR